MINTGLDDAALRLFLNLAGASVALYLLDVILKFLGGLTVFRWVADRTGPLQPWLRFVRPLLLTALAWSLLAPVGIDLADADIATRALWLVGLFLLVYMIGEGLWRIGLAVMLAGVTWLFVATGFGLVGSQSTIVFGWLLIAAAAPILWFLGATFVEAFDEVPILSPLAHAFASVCYLLAGTTGLIGLGAALIALSGVLLVGGSVLLLILLPLVCVAILLGIFLEPFITRRGQTPPPVHQ